MRPIKFRCWDIESKKMFKSIFHQQVSPEWFIEKSELYNVMQFTGLLDKNGKDIYEGDIVEVFCDCGENNEPDCIQEVKWSTEGGYLCNEECGNDFLPLLGNDDLWLEVIGNIYENGDLLK